MAAAAGGAFEGFLPQITGRLGPVRRVEAATADGVDRGFAVFHLGAPGGEVGTAVTNGLRFGRRGGAAPQELCCTLLIDQEETAHRIVVQVARKVLAGAVAPAHGVVVRGEDLFAPGAGMAGVVCAGHPFVDREFGLVRGADGRIRLQITALIPATDAELLLAARRGADALFARWHARDADLADLGRRSAA